MMGACWSVGVCACLLLARNVPEVAGREQNRVCIYTRSRLYSHGIIVELFGLGTSCVYGFARTMIFNSFVKPPNPASGPKPIFPHVEYATQVVYDFANVKNLEVHTKQQPHRDHATLKFHFLSNFRISDSMRIHGRAGMCMWHQRIYGARSAEQILY